MEKILTDNVKDLVSQLIYGVSGFDEKHEHFNEILDYSFAHICSPDYFGNYGKSEILRTVRNLADKFKFHAFPDQANYLQTLTEKLLNSCKNAEELEVNLAILKLLLTISRSPVKYFIEDVNRFRPLSENVEQIVDWGSYLNNCKVVLKQNYAETSDEDWSDFEESDVEVAPQRQQVQTCQKPARKAEKPIFQYNILEAGLVAKQELATSIQSNWWNTKEITVIPSSNSCESKIALEWDKYVSEMSLGLVNPKTNIIPEYRIIRELIWQFFAPNSCFSFGFEDGKIRPKTGVTIGSLRPQTLQNFLGEFMPYIEKLRLFRSFHESLLGDYFVTSIPDTFRSYWEALEELLAPVYEKIQEMEDNIRKQEDITTILKIASDLKPIFKNISLLSLIHEDITQNYNVDLSFQNTTFLLSRLFFGLLNSANTTEQNIYLTLYLKSLYKYFTIIEIWLEQDTLDDESDEFIVYIKNSRNTIGDKTSLEYKLKSLDSFSEIDGMMQIIQKKVLQLAKNIHLLRLLGKLYLVSDQMDSFKVSLHEEYIDKIITEASNYSQNLENQHSNIELIESTKDSEVFTVICPEKLTSKTGTDSVDNFLELSDGFLATIFQPFLFKEAEPDSRKTEPTLFEKVNAKITRMFPAKQILEKTFLEVLNSRYSIPGLLVKDILLEQFKLMQYFHLMKHLYLFDEDIIFPFYKHMFRQFENQQAWGNFFWLTSQLQDLLMDLYSDVYECCRVDVEPSWRLCTNPIAACDLVTLHVRLDWPISLIFRQEHKKMYNKIFQFLLKIKWALNTLNRLQFSELEPKNKPFKLQPKLIQQRIRKLQAMRFVLLNDLSSIQHYILGHLLSVLWAKFTENFEKSYDLESIIKAHDLFIKRIYTFCMKLKHEKSEIYGFKKILSLVLQLQSMWKDVIKIDDQHLRQCEIEYRKSHKFLRPIIDVEVITF